jgi:signal transduction histidine kinase
LLVALFSPFFTTKPTSKGTGLGLYMSLDIIKSHRGTIEVDSKEGEFTMFIIKIHKNEGLSNE